jgi:HK97 family phage portal protein
VGVANFVKHSLSYFYPELRLASLENPSTPLSSFDSDPKTVTQIHVSEEGSLAIATVFACVKVIAETMAMMELEVFKRNGKTKSADITHSIYPLLNRDPSPLYTRFEFIETMMCHVLLWGNGYSKIIRNKFGEPKELRILLPWEVTPKITERGRIFYEIRYDNGPSEVILPDNIIHLKNLGTNGLVGMSPIAIQRENMANAVAKQQHEGAFYANGAKASGILMTPGTMGSKEQTNLKSSFEKATEGPKNRFKTIILEEGVKYQQLTIPQNDAQFLETKKFDQTEICGWFRVPPHMVANLTDANYSNIESQDRSFAKHTMAPWTTRVQLEFDRKLFFEDERGIWLSQFNLDDITKGDIKARYEAWNTGIQAGFIKPKWATESEGWPTDNAPEQDQFFMNGTMRPVKLLIKEAEEEKEPAQPPTEKAA